MKHEHLVQFLEEGGYEMTCSGDNNGDCGISEGGEFAAISGIVNQDPMISSTKI